MTNDEAIEVLDLAVRHWHKVLDNHGQLHCNCFRVAFGNALMEKYNVELHDHIPCYDDRRQAKRRKH